MNLFKLVDKMHDKLLYSHHQHCTAYQCWRPGFLKAIYSTGNTSRKILLYANNKTADQPAHSRSLLNAFAFAA